MIRIPVGYDNFGSICREGLDFIDKSLFIKELLDEQTQVTLITRPRRFGKTLALSMLQHFLTPEAYGLATAGLFDSMKIAQCGEAYMQHQGKYPVIYVTFKDVKDHNFERSFGNFRNLMSRLYTEHNAILKSDQLSESQKAVFSKIENSEGTPEQIQAALFNLCQYLHQCYGVKPWLLIDEYDTPLQAAYAHDYFDEMLALIRGVFSLSLKSNPHLNRAVITGILHVAKASLFSDLNSIQSYSLLNSRYSEYFGFTEQEMSEILEKSGLKEQAAVIRNWYNGYQVGKTVIYNPWSIACCLANDGELKAYWVHTSGNVLIKQLLAHAGADVKQDFEQLLRGEPIEATIHEHTVFSDLRKYDRKALYSLLLLSGYLKALDSKEVDSEFICTLAVPNREVLALYRTIIVDWFAEHIERVAYTYDRFLNALVSGQIEEFSEVLRYFLRESLSVFDTQGQHPEIFYHGFVLGLTVSLRETHEVRSNRESGYGRYDVMLIPKDTKQLGLVLEFKTMREPEVILAEAAEKALEQIADRAYVTELQQRGIAKTLAVGFAFRGKEVAVRWKFESK